MIDQQARTVVVWIPDWPIVAARQILDAPAGSPVALIHHGSVFACSSEARRDGVRRGLAVREAQLRCPELWIAPYDSGVDARAFEPAVAAIEALVPGVRILRPGLCAMRARGASRFYGGEALVAETLLSGLDRVGIPARVGIADSVFAAEQAAQRSTAQAPVNAIDAGQTPSFLFPLPVSTLDDPALVPVLSRLGLHRLGDFAALDRVAVGARFGEPGLVAHARASGTDRLTGAEHAPPPDFDAVVSFEPALDRVDQIAFALRTASEDMIERLSRAALVCTALRITVASESGERSEREWSHPHHFTAADVVDRVRWQLQGSGGAAAGPESPVERVEVSPVRVDSSTNHESGLWGTSLDERVHHALARLHSLLGHGAVSTPSVGGGRFLAERRVLVPWGDETPTSRADLPWPGSIPEPAPSTVFADAVAADVRGANGEQVTVDERGVPNTAPAWLSLAASPALPVSSWAGPWPVHQRWWDSERRGSADRFQMVDGSGTAWLMMLENREWRAEARYD